MCGEWKVSLESHPHCPDSESGREGKAQEMSPLAVSGSLKQGTS